MQTIRNCNQCGEELHADETKLFCVTCVAPEKSRTAQRTLTTRERQLVELVQQAKTNKQIAFELSLSEGTIKEYLNRLFRKLGVGSRTELAIWAFRQRQAA